METQGADLISAVYTIILVQGAFCLKSYSDTGLANLMGFALFLKGVDSAIGYSYATCSEVNGGYNRGQAMTLAQESWTLMDLQTKPRTLCENACS